MELNNDPFEIKHLLRRKFGVLDINKAYLAIDYSKKTELMDNYGNTICHTRSYAELLAFAEKTLTEELP